MQRHSPPRRIVAVRCGTLALTSLLAVACAGQTTPANGPLPSSRALRPAFSQYPAPQPPGAISNVLPTPTASPKPTPAPSPSPSAAPTPVPTQPAYNAPQCTMYDQPGQSAAIVVSQCPVELGGAAGRVVTLTVSEAGYSGTFTLASDAPSIAAVPPRDLNGNFAVVGGSAGQTFLVVTDAQGNFLMVPAINTGFIQ